jgi:ABC-2 type transport system ATP-binding protein
MAMAMAANLLEPIVGTMRVFGAAPESPEASRKTAFLTQDKPRLRRPYASEGS